MERHVPIDGQSGPDALAPLQLPIFKDPEVSRLARAAVIDIGSNSVRMVVFDGAARSPAFFYNEKVMCGLGASLAETGRLDPGGKKRARAAIQRFVAIAESMQATILGGVATAACRMATDGPSFCARITEKTGLPITITSGHEEARLAARGVLLGWPQADGLVCDIGGASMELAEVRQGTIGHCLSAPLGPMLFNRPMDADTMTRTIRQQIRALRKEFRGSYRALYLVGGSWRTIAKIDMARRAYPLRVINEYSLSRDALARTLTLIETSAAANQLGKLNVSPDRIHLVPIAARILRALVDDLQTEEIAVSAYGIREGVLYDNMPGKLRKRDPLIEACLHAEYASARMPGYGSLMFSFIAPLLKSCTDEQQRLIQAACILHDVSWRAHPDYRAVSCFDFATRASLGGIDHAGRVFLAYALFNRYKNTNVPAYAQSMLGLLTPEETERAVMVGKALRFAAMLTVGSPDSLGRLKFKPRRHVLTLELPQSVAIVLGETVMERFRALALAMRCKPRVIRIAP